MRNGAYIAWDDNGKPGVPHFRMREFENCDGFVMITSGLVEALEGMRRDLVEVHGPGIQVIITSALRTELENKALGERLGWADQGGLVARDSHHLPKYGGIAVDLFARYKHGQGYMIVGQRELGVIARRYFNYVKSDYKDGHIHCDMRGNQDGKKV